MVQWLGKFIPNLSKHTEPISKLKRKNITFKWSDECDIALSKIKNAIRLAKPLRYPDFAKTFFVVTDASDHAIGAVLLQKHEDVYYPIEFLSKQLDIHQRNWHCSEKEVYAVVFALEKWKRYLLPKKFTVYTDHRNLVELFTKNKYNSKLNRWILRLQPFHFEAKWIADDNNVIADYLSRDIITNPEYVDYTRGDNHNQDMNYIAVELFTISDSQSLITNKSTKEEVFVQGRLRRSSRLKNKTTVDYRVPNESEIYVKPPH